MYRRLHLPSFDRFYPARFHKYYNSIFALGDICDLIPDESADVCFLEEPEHLNWYRGPGESNVGQLAKGSVFVEYNILPGSKLLPSPQVSRLGVINSVIASELSIPTTKRTCVIMLLLDTLPRLC